MHPDEPILSDIREDWAAVGPALEILCNENPTFGLQPLHVRDACDAEQADFWRAPEGFLVTRFITDEDSGVRTLFIWVAYAFERHFDLTAKYLPFFEEVAKHTKCKYIETWSSRGGMERYLARHNFKLFYRSFRKEV